MNHISMYFNGIRTELTKKIITSLFLLQLRITENRHEKCNSRSNEIIFIKLTKTKIPLIGRNENNCEGQDKRNRNLNQQCFSLFLSFCIFFLPFYFEIRRRKMIEKGVLLIMKFLIGTRALKKKGKARIFFFSLE